MSRRASDCRQLARKPLGADQLARDFRPRAEAVRLLVAALYEALLDRARPEATAALGRWKALSRDLYPHALDGHAPGARSLAESYGVCPDVLRPAELLFSVQTGYALLVELLVGEVLAVARRRPRPAQQIGRAERVGQLRAALEAWDESLGVAAWGVGNSPCEPEAEPFSWYRAALDESMAASISRLAAEISRYDCEAMARRPTGEDLLKGVFEQLFPRRFRHALGQYSTPDWLAEHVLDQVGYSGQRGARVLDPACGSGTFLLAAIRRLRAAQGRRVLDSHARAKLLDAIRRSVVGFDLDPLAVMSARANYLIAVCDLLPRGGAVWLPVERRDAILGRSGGAAGGESGFDYVVGNPPWIAWDHLSPEYRQATRPLWQRYGLFSLGGTAARHGGAKKDLAMLMLYAAADQNLKDHGRLGMVVTQTLFQTKGAGDGFRRFRLGDEGAWLHVLRVDDLVALRPFAPAANWTSTLVLEKGSPTVYPVPYVTWSRASGNTRPPRIRREVGQAEPMDPARPTSPWLIRPRRPKAAPRTLFGPSEYQAHLGANSGGANGVYWVQLLAQADGAVLVRNLAGQGKRPVASLEHLLEPDLLYPLVRWSDVTRFHAAPSAHLLLAQDPRTRCGIDAATLRGRYPRTYAYLNRFRAILSDRAAYRRYQPRAPFWSMYDVGPYTVAPYKVVWRRMDRGINAAVLAPLEHPWLGVRPVIPQETCVLVAADSLDEAHYLCALMNSSAVDAVVRAHSVRGGKGFGTPSILEFLGLPRFDPHNARHAALAACSRQAHRHAQRGEEAPWLQRRMDRLAAGRP